MDKITHEVRCQQWTAIINECLSSGMSKRTWCQTNGISEKQFFYWQRILRKEAYLDMKASSKDLPAVSETGTASTPVRSTSFVEISVPSEETLPEKFQPDCVVRSAGLTVEISNTISPELMSMLGGLLHA